MSKPLIDGGYILLSRKLIESGIMNKPPMYLKVWIWLLLKAQHKDYKTLKRGEYKTSIPEIMEAMTYKIGFRKVTPTKKEIFGIIKWLRFPYEGNDEGSMMVTMKVTHGFVYKVLNYDLYQDPKNYEGNDEGSTKVTMKVEVREQYKQECYKNDKNEKNKSNILCGEIIDYLNQATNSRYKKTDANKSFINARINEGATLDDFKNVIDKKYAQWKGTEYQKFIRPQTLFGTKFDSYLNEKVVSNKSQNFFLDKYREEYDDDEERND